MGSDTFVILGTASGVPQAGKVCSGYVLESDNSLTLFDCGGGVTSAFLRAGFDFRNVDRIIISHSHSDHVCELSLFLQGMYLARREHPVNLYLPGEFVDIFKSYLTAVYLFPERFSFPLAIRGYSGESDFEAPVSISAFPNSHLQKYRPYADKSGGANELQSHSFIIATKTRRLLYSADIGSFEDIASRLEGLDYVVTELSHVDRTEFLRRAKDSRVGRLIVTHLDGPSQKEEIESLARAAGVTNIEFAAEGMRLLL